MKNKNHKLIKYYLVTAFLVVSISVNATVHYGKILLDYTTPAPPEIIFDGDAFLDHNLDLIFIDMDCDDEPDFAAIMHMNSPSTVSPFPDLSSSESTILNPAPPNSLMVMMIAFNKPGLIGLDDGYINNFAIGDMIGPFGENSDYQGLLTYFSNNNQQSTTTTGPQPIPFNPFGDHGFIGVALEDEFGFKYGYIQINIDVNSQSVEFINCALEYTPNKAIAAGKAVPLLPIASAAGLILIGLIGAIKKRRKKLG